MPFKTEVIFCSDVVELKKRLQKAGSMIVVVGEEIEQYFNDMDHESVKSGETCKDIRTVEFILRKAIERKLNRDSWFVGVGGGSVTDVTGFAASVYMRGCRLINVPTTLLGMVDAAYGGKTGCNFSGVKNVVGSFYPATLLFICSEFLDTLPKEEIRSGMGEVIKYAVLDKTGELMRLLEKGIDNRYDQNEMIRHCLAVKDELVRDDLYDTHGVREAANLGHTFAHALESYSGYSIPHGVAVAWGLRCAICCGSCSGEYRKRVENVLDKYGLNDSFRISESEFDRFFEPMLLDKKRRNGEMRFVIPMGQGKVIITSPSYRDIKMSVVH